MLAIRHEKGPMMVLAGPGSGKTSVITQHTRYLIENLQVAPSNILVITFTKAAALEMKERFYSLTKGAGQGITFGTFHAVFFNILKHAYGYTGANIVRDDVKYTFLRDYIHRHEISFDDEQEMISGLLAEISTVKNEEIQIDNYYATSCPQQEFRDLFQAYRKYLYQNRLIDFDDMLVYTKDLLSQRKDILAAWQNKYRYILIDEFQDINRIQYEIIRMLAAPQNNLFIVGDDDQSIYRFRGAKPELMLSFPKDYPNVKTVTLKHNYRCGESIAMASRKLIRHNEKRYKKEFLPVEGLTGEVRHTHFDQQRTQNLKIIREIIRLKQEGYAYSDIAILSRTNKQPLYLMEQLSGFNIPWHSRERVPNFYDHWIVRDVFTYVRLAQGERTTANFLKVMNRPNRYLSRDSLPSGSGQIRFTEWQQYYKNQPWVIQRLRKFREDLKTLSGMRPYAALVYIRKAIGYEDYLKSYALERGLDADELLDILLDLTERARSYETFYAWEIQIEKVREESKKQNEKKATLTDAVEITTYHSAKGLEYPIVFLPDLNESIVPYKKAVLPEDIEEERRMLYVAITRAKDKLYLSDCAQVRNKDMEPSRFLNEISKVTGKL